MFPGGQGERMTSASKRTEKTTDDAQAGIPESRDSVNRRGLLLALVPLLLSLALAGGIYYYFAVVAAPPAVVRIAADRSGSDIRELLEAVSKIAAKRAEGVAFDLRPTDDPARNIQLLEEGKVDFAAIPADAVTRPNFSLVADLYPDTYHVVVRADSGIRSIHDLEGRRIAVPSYKTAAYRSFWFMIGQYGLNPERMRPFPLSREAALRALRKGEVQGMFMMLPPGDRHIRWLAETTDIRILPVDQAAAMAQRRAALQIVTLPRALYSGNPVLPEQDTVSVAAARMLVTRKDVDPKVVNTLTSVLFENRRDLSIYSHLANFIAKPGLEGGTILPVHPGALNYYNRDQPSFLQQNAEVIGVLFSILAVSFSGLMWLRRSWLERQKGRADVYNLDLVKIARRALDLTDAEELRRLNRKLYDMLEQVVHDLDEDRIDGEGFHYFAFTWEMAMKTISEAARALGVEMLREEALSPAARTALKSLPKRPA